MTIGTVKWWIDSDDMNLLRAEADRAWKRLRRLSTRTASSGEGV